MSHLINALANDLRLFHVEQTCDRTVFSAELVKVNILKIAN